MFSVEATTGLDLTMAKFTVYTADIAPEAAKPSL
jgi:hypothetical protein